MRSNLVMTAKVLLPSGSTSLASLRASEVAKSVVAGVTAKIKLLGLLTKLKISS